MIGNRVLILGSGPAGYTAAIYALRAGLRPEIIAGLQPGGQLTITTTVDNWPGRPGILGPSLMEEMKQHCLNLGCVVHEDSIVELVAARHPFQLRGENRSYEGDSIVLACGASAKMLNLPDEDQYVGRGLSTCATCDGFFYKDKKVAIVGGGNTAAEETLYLAGLTDQICLIHRRDALRADAILQKRLFTLADAGKLRFYWNRTIERYLGDANGLNGLILHSRDDSQQEQIVVDGLFIAIGHSPNTDFLGDHLDLNQGYVQVRGGSGAYQTASSCPGIFAAGDVADPHYRQAITSAGMGCMAALDAKHYLDDLRSGKH